MIKEEMYARCVDLSVWPRVEGFIDLAPRPPKEWQRLNEERMQDLLAGLRRL